MLRPAIVIPTGSLGGWHESGIGVRHGAAGIRKYCRTHSVLVTRFAPKRELHMYPYSKAGTKVLETVMRTVHIRAGRR